MTNKAKYFLITFVVMATVVTVYLNTHAINWSEYEKELDRLREIRLVDTMIDQEIVQLRYQLYANYDFLGDNIRELRHLADALGDSKSSDLAKLKNVALYKELLHELLLEKINKTVLFNAANAALKASIIQIPRLNSLIKQRLRNQASTRGLIEFFDLLEKDILLYNLVEDSDLGRQINLHMQKLASLKDLPDRPLNDYLEQLSQHIQLSISKREEINQLALSISDIKINDITRDLQRAYLDNHQGLLDQNLKYRITLYILSILLLFYTGSVLLSLRHKTKELAREKDHALVTLNSISEGVITTDAETRIQLLNPVAEKILGFTNEQARGQRFDDLFDIREESSNKAVSGLVEKCLRTGNTLKSGNQNILVNKNGLRIAVEQSVAPIIGDDQTLHGAIIVMRDVSQTRELSHQLTHQARHDSLTGVINRRAFEDRLKESVNHAKQRNHEHALLYIDLDQFKIVNDTCGHNAGDHLLVQLTTLLQTKLGPNDTLARLGGDEFGILLENSRLPRAILFAEDVLESFKQFKYVWQGISFQPGASIGVVAINEDSGDIASILSAADIACYVAKDGGRNRCHVFNAQDSELIRRQGEMQWVSRITHALKENQFSLYRQPIQALPHSNGDHRHYEILVRLHNQYNNQRFVLPGAFIPAAERYNLMPSVDRWIIRHALEYCARHGHGDCYSINLSGTSLNSDNILGFIQTELDRSSINPTTLCFEITETAAIENLTKAAELITTLKTYGVKFALDDFGKGLSSFTYLNALPVDYLKIDGEFVQNLSNKPVYLEIVKAINHIAHMMGMQTIAECVEDQVTLRTLTHLGVDYAQGFELGLPEPMSTIKHSTQAQDYSAQVSQA